MEASKQQNKSRIELFDNEERVKLIEEVQQRPILWDLTDKKQKSKARYKRQRSNFQGNVNREFNVPLHSGTTSPRTPTGGIKVGKSSKRCHSSRCIPHDLLARPGQAAGGNRKSQSSNCYDYCMLKFIDCNRC
ncbi:hypothetical protein ACLKA7_011756 [Drosophila subpalustris]